MKREQKFRAWTKKKTMQYNVVPFQWDYVIDTMWHKCIGSNGPGFLGSGGTEAKFEVGGYAINEGDLMQFTGLKDKNGKEIFESDIVKMKNIKGSKYNNINFAVIYFMGTFQMFRNDELPPLSFIYLAVQLKQKRLITNDLQICKHIKIIGNIYENPELLK